MVKKGMKKFLAGMCAVLVMPTGTVQNVLAKQPEQVLPVSEEKAINQSLKLWYNSPANINTQKRMAANGCNSHYLWEMEIWVI